MKFFKNNFSVVERSMKKITFSLFILIHIVSCNAQKLERDLNINDNILLSANKMMQFLITKEYNGFVDALYPKFIEKVGGKDKMLEGLNLAYEQLESQGIVIDSVILSKPYKIIDTGIELQTTIVETLIMTVPQGKMISKSTLIAISTDNGLTWYFMDTSGKDLKTMQVGFPNLSDRLIIAKMEKPIVYTE